MRIVLAIIGSIVGAVLASGAHELLGLVLGGFAGFAAAELNLLRQRLRLLEDELSALRRIAARQPRSDTDVGSREAGQSWHAEAKAALQPEAAAGAGASPAGTVPAAQAPGTRDANPLFRVVREYFTGGNALVRVGIIILFFGVAFLLRYIAEHSKVPVGFRLSGVAAGALALLLLGWWLRRRRPGYALALQGGAVGILYLTVFAGLRLYSLVPAGVAFALLVFLATLCAALAVLQNSQAFALLAVSGGFLAPVLASNGHGSHIVLFSYYAVLNAAIVAVAWFRAWRVLNLAGFLFTFVIGIVWGVLSYQTSLFTTTEPFLILFSLFYVAIAVLFATRQPPRLRGYVDGTLVFGTPIAAFGVQSTMVHDWPYALAYSALAAGALYLVIAWLLHGIRRQTHRLLVEAFTAIGVLFLTLAVPLALDGRWSAATWALEGAALVWIGCRQARRLARSLGALLQIAAGVFLWLELDSPHGHVPVFNTTFLGGVLVSAASVLAASLLHRYRERLPRYEGAVASVLYFWGLLWWLFNGLTEIQRRVPDRYDAAVSLLFFTVTALVSGALYGRARLTFARLPALWLLPAMIFYAALAVVEVHHPLADAGWAAWPLAFAALYFLYRRHEGAPNTVLANSLHVGAAWLLIALATWEAAWAVDQATSGRGSWAVIVRALVPALGLFLTPRLVRRIVWPFTVHAQAYAAIAGTGLALYLAIWTVTTNVLLPGDAAPFPFLPLLNPLDLGEAFVLLVLLRFWLHLRAARHPLYTGVKDPPGFAIVAALTFVWLNAALLRALYHWAGIPFRLQAMLHSTLVQTALTIFWAVLALTTMLAATRKRIRPVWLTGAGLLCVVIAKLFLVDLSHVGTIERIVSFVGVGVLMLVIGYFSPLPPASERPREIG